MNNALSNTLISNENHENLDAACKAVLAEKQILAWILKGCAEEYAECSIEEIVDYIDGEPEIGTIPVEKDLTGRYLTSKIVGQQEEDSSIYEGTIRYDIRFTARIPGQKDERQELLINVEAQNTFNPGYSLLTRGIYYCSRMLSAQKGTVFAGSDYDRLKKVQSIWLCIRPSESWKGSITSYSLTEKNVVGNCKSDVEAYDKLNVTLVCLGNKTDEKNVISLLDMLMATTMTPSEKQKKLEDDFSIRTTENLKGRLSDMCNYSVGVYSDGRELGREEGREDMALNSIRKLMEKSKMTVTQALDFLDILDPVERERYQKMLTDG